MPPPGLSTRGGSPLAREHSNQPSNRAQELDMEGKRSLDNLVSATGGRGAGGGDKAAAAAQSFYQLMSVFQWWFFNVVVVISNKYIFQVRIRSAYVLNCFLPGLRPGAD